MFYLIDKLLTGDLVFALTAWLACLASCLLTSAAKWRWWGKLLFFVALSLALVLLAHYWLDLAQNWYTTPLGEKMIIVK